MGQHQLCETYVVIKCHLLAKYRLTETDSLHTLQIKPGGCYNSPGVIEILYKVSWGLG